MQGHLVLRIPLGVVAMMIKTAKKDTNAMMVDVKTSNKSFKEHIGCQRHKKTKVNP